MTLLEKNGIIQKITRTAINYEKLDITTIHVGLNVLQQNQQEVLELLRAQNNIKHLYKTYGTHNIIVIAHCNKGKEGQTINRIKAIAEKFNVTKLAISVCFSWEKMDHTPFITENRMPDEGIFEEEKEGIIVDFK